MRRRRQKLTVSTFPFLAVLLGAMGSLIFLLLIMDRRAKIVARNKVREMQESRLAELSEAARRRQAAWEKQRQELHEALQQEDVRWRGQLTQVRIAHADLAAKSQAEAAAQNEVLAAIAREQAALRALQAARSRLEQQQAARQAAQRAAQIESARLEETQRAEMARLTRELLELEQAADALKRLKQQARRPAFSLVPYRGQRGASRMPIYVECTSEGLSFLPERARFTGPELDVPAFRAEVERRHGPLLKEQRDADPFRTPESTQPYVLFLIRPDGIPAYYRAQRALGGYQIDFGYELVNADWKLEVPSAEQVAQLAIEEPRRPAFRASPGAGDANAPGARRGGQVANLPDGPGGTFNARGADPARAAAAGSAAAGSAAAGSAATLAPPVPDIPIPGAMAPRAMAPRGGAPDTLGKTEPATAKNEPGTTKGDGADPPQPPAAAALAQDGEPGSGQPVSRPAGLFEKGRAGLANPALGSRDFVIDLACYGDGVVVTPGGAAFNYAKAADAKAVDRALVQNIRRIIASRQATLRPGDAPYRPVLRFVVHPEGLRSMYRVYPTLERLGVAMVRENVEE